MYIIKCTLKANWSDLNNKIQEQFVTKIVNVCYFFLPRKTSEVVYIVYTL